MMARRVLRVIGGSTLTFVVFSLLAQQGEQALPPFVLTMADPLHHPPLTLTPGEEGRLKSGSAAERITLGKKLLLGEGIKRDPARAFNVFSSVAVQDPARGGAWVGRCLIDGSGTPSNVPLGIALVQKAAESGDPEGIRMLGDLYHLGEVVRRDDGRAISLYTRAVDLGDVAALDRLATMELNGFGGPRSVQTAFSHYMAAAIGGDQFGMLHLGMLYRSGHVANIAARSTLPRPPLTGDSLQMHAGSVAVAPAPDYVLAREWFLKSAAKGTPAASFYLGEMYTMGEGVKQDYDTAFLFYRAAAAGRFTPAMLALAQMNEEGVGRAVDRSKAAFWYKEAVRLGNQRAVDLLAKLQRLQDTLGESHD